MKLTQICASAIAGLFLMVAGSAQATPTVVELNNASFGFFTEGGYNFVSLVDHMHPWNTGSDSGLDNHSSCCSTPYQITAVGGGLFSLSSIVVADPYGYGAAYQDGFYFTGSNGNTVYVPAGLLGNFSFAGAFDNVTWVNWNEDSFDSFITSFTFNDNTSVPAPGALALLGLGLLGLGAARRRKAA